MERNININGNIYQINVDNINKISTELIDSLGLLSSNDCINNSFVRTALNEILQTIYIKGINDGLKISKF